MVATVSSALFAGLLLLLSRAASADDAQCYRIATPAGTGGTSEIAEITRHVFQKAGFCAVVLRVPAKRIDAEIEEGEADGWVRAIGPEAVPDKFLLIPNDLGHLEGGLFWPPGAPEPRGDKAVIGAVLGQEWADMEVRRRGARLYEVIDNQQLMRMAIERRIQGFLVPEFTYRHLIRAFPELQTFSGRAVADLRIRLALQPRLTPIASRLDKAAAATMEEGFAASVWRKYLSQAPSTVPWQQMDKVIKP